MTQFVVDERGAQCVELGLLHALITDCPAGTFMSSEEYAPFEKWIAEGRGILDDVRFYLGAR